MFKRKLTWIDLLIVLVIATSILGFSYKISQAKMTDEANPETNILHLTFFMESVPDYVIEGISISSPVVESIQGSNFGRVTEIKKDEAIFWKSDEEGNLVKSGREGYSSLSITMEVEGIITGKGMSIDKSVYFVGQTTTLYAGDSILKDGRISAISEAN